jgi:hypothetical protein
MLETPRVLVLAAENYQNRSHHCRDKFSAQYQHEKHKFSHSIYTGQSCNFFTSAVIMGAQKGEMSKLG